MTRIRKAQDRKRDARDKIELGGLIVKAGLRYEKRALLLGALVDIGRRLQSQEGERARLTAIGSQAFGDDHD
jgi:hypothetical protein